MVGANAMVKTLKVHQEASILEWIRWAILFPPAGLES